MSSTKQRLISAAAKLFAEKGYEQTSVADICELAKANIASVNYHFGNKEKLLFLVMGYCNDIAADKYPLRKMNENNEISAQEKLDFFVYNKLKRIFSVEEAGYMYRIKAKMSPDEKWGEEIFMRYILVEIEYMEELIQELSSRKLSSEESKLCVLNVMSVFKMFVTTPKAREIILGEYKDDGSAIVEKIHSKILGFICAGIKSYSGEQNV